MSNILKSNEFPSRAKPEFRSELVDGMLPETYAASDDTIRVLYAEFGDAILSANNQPEQQPTAQVPPSAEVREYTERMDRERALAARADSQRTEIARNAVAEAMQRVPVNDIVQPEDRQNYMAQLATQPDASRSFNGYDAAQARRAQIEQVSRLATGEAQPDDIVMGMN